MISLTVTSTRMFGRRPAFANHAVTSCAMLVDGSSRISGWRASHAGVTAAGTFQPAGRIARMGVRRIGVSVSDG